MVKKIAASVVLAYVAGACGGSSGAGSGLSGQIVADGSSTVFPITQAVAEEFRAEAPDVRVSVGTSGTGGGFEKFCRGETDLSNASRPIKREEAAVCARNGVQHVELKVAIDGLSVVVNPENDWATCLTVAELRKIWEPNSRVTNWRQVRAGFPNRALTLYGPGTDSGTFDYFTDEIVGDEGKSRSDYTASEDDNVLVQGVSGDPGALGYFGYGYFEQNRSKLKPLGIDGGDGCVTPSADTINGGAYKPLSRPLFVYISKSAAARVEVKAFMQFYVDNVSALVRDVGYIALPEAGATALKQAWERAAA